MRRLIAVAAVFQIALARPAAPADPEPSLRDVLQRAATYTADFAHRLTGIVSEESYEQDIETLAGTRQLLVTHRALKSDFLLVQMTGRDRYVEFRDVYEVDGRRVRDRQERLTKLFLDPAAGPKFEAITAESARYNIGRVTRTVNTPLLPLMFLLPEVQARFQFKRGSDARPATVKPGSAGSANFSVSTEVWIVEYTEKTRPTVVRNLKGRDLPSRGRFWVEPGTGRVLMSELVAEDSSVLATIDVSYQSEPLIGLSVPVEMRERYDVRGDGSVITGIATYGKFRQFTVNVHEDIAAPKR